MRFLILIALCVAAASATYTTRNRFNHLLRSLRQQQGLGGYGPQGMQSQLYGLDEDQNEDEYYQQQYKQCSRNQRCSMNLDDDESEYDQDDEYPGQYQRQGRYQPEQFEEGQEQFQGPFQQRQRRGPHYRRYIQDQDDQEQYQSPSQRQQYFQDQDDQEQDQDQYQGPFQGQRRGPQNRQYSQDQDDQEQYQSPYQRQQYLQEQEDQDQDQYQGQYQGQFQGQFQGQNQQQKRIKQQRHQCKPKYQLLQQLEQPNCQLASKLYKQAKHENDDKNTVVSPCALQLALAAIQRGARGNTQRQLQRIIGPALSRQQNRQAHSALQQSLQGQDPIQRQIGQRQQAKIKASTTIVINQRNRAQQRFIQAVQACLNVQVKKCDFQRQPQQCRQQINRYVAQKTQHKLRQVVPQDAVTQNTKMIVINTAQVKAQWGRQFRQQQQTTVGRFFPLGCKQPKPVQVLQSQGQFPYYEDEQLKVVGIPTQQQELTLYVIVPKNKDGLNQVEKSKIQDGEQLKQLLEHAEQYQQQVHVELPKFQIKHKIDAKQTLRKEGVQHVFEADEADLSVINGQQPLEQQERRHRQPYGQYEEEQQYGQYQQYQDEEQRQQQLHVNKLIQQATIKIDEHGIGAAQPHPGQYGPQGQYQEQNQYEDEFNGEDEQEQQYYQQQWQREELFGQIFGQGQRRQGQYGQRRFRSRQCQEEGQCGEQKNVKANRAFAFALKHNPSNQIVLVGRVVDATQKPRSQQHQGQRWGQQTLNGVDQQ